MSFNLKTSTTSNSTSISPPPQQYYNSRHSPVIYSHSPTQLPNRIITPAASNALRNEYFPIQPVQQQHHTSNSNDNQSPRGSSSRNSIANRDGSYSHYDVDRRREVSNDRINRESWDKRDREREEEMEDELLDLDDDMEDSEMGHGSGTSESRAARERKRSRTLTTNHQTSVLNALLTKTRFPSTETREEVGQQIGMSARRVQIWFQNRRQSQKRARDRDVPESSSGGYSQFSSSSSNQSHQQPNFATNGQNQVQKQSREYYPEDPYSNTHTRFPARPLVTHHNQSSQSIRNGGEDNNNNHNNNRNGDRYQNRPNSSTSSTSDDINSRRLNSANSSNGGRKDYDYNEFEDRISLAAGNRWTGKSLSFPPPNSSSSSHSWHHSISQPHSPPLSSPPTLAPIKSKQTSPSPPNTGISNTSSSSNTSSIRESGIKLPPISALFTGGNNNNNHHHNNNNNNNNNNNTLPLASPLFQQHLYREHQALYSPSAHSFTSDRSSRGILSPDFTPSREEDPFNFLPQTYPSSRQNSTTTIRPQPNQSQSQQLNQVEDSRRLSPRAQSIENDSSSTHSSSSRPNSSSRDSPPSTSNSMLSLSIPTLASLALYTPTEERKSFISSLSQNESTSCMEDQQLNQDSVPTSITGLGLTNFNHSQSSEVNGLNEELIKTPSQSSTLAANTFTTVDTLLTTSTTTTSTTSSTPSNGILTATSISSSTSSICINESLTETKPSSSINFSDTNNNASTSSGRHFSTSNLSRGSTACSDITTPSTEIFTAVSVDKNLLVVEVINNNKEEEEGFKIETQGTTSKGMRIENLSSVEIGLKIETLGEIEGEGEGEVEKIKRSSIELIEGEVIMKKEIVGWEF